jgi:hypothetical protein
MSEPAVNSVVARPEYVVHAHLKGGVPETLPAGCNPHRKLDSGSSDSEVVGFDLASLYVLTDFEPSFKGIEALFETHVLGICIRFVFPTHHG